MEAVEVTAKTGECDQAGDLPHACRICSSDAIRLLTSRLPMFHKPGIRRGAAGRPLFREVVRADDHFHQGPYFGPSDIKIIIRIDPVNEYEFLIRQDGQQMDPQSCEHQKGQFYTFDEIGVFRILSTPTSADNPDLITLRPLLPSATAPISPDGNKPIL